MVPLPPEVQREESLVKSSFAVESPWVGLRRFTAARIALGRTGGSQTTATLLDFRLSHARARDAVHAPFPAEVLAESLREAGVESTLLRSGASSREQFLLRPDLGRSLDKASAERLRCLAQQWGQRDLVIILSDGLSAQATMNHAVPTTLALLRALASMGWSCYPVLLVPFARVKLQDEVGQILGARMSLMLLGERPGLGSPDSLGAYFTYLPEQSRTDADRNCLSNIRAEGLAPELAAAKLATLLHRAMEQKSTGVQLKDEGEILAGLATSSQSSS